MAMKKSVFLVPLLLLALLCAPFSALGEAAPFFFGVAPAAGTVETENTLPSAVTSVQDYVFSTNPEDAGQPLRTRPDTPETAHVKFFAYSQNIVLRGIFEKNGYFFNIPKYWDTRYALAQIQYTVSPLIQDVPASLTFFINDHPIYSCRVEYENGASQIVFVSIPVELLRVGYNEFAITGYVRLYDEDGCLDDFSGANWINISENSVIEAGYDLVDFGSKISFYPYPLMSTMDELGENLTVYVPQDATAEELRAAFLLRADLGDETGNEDRIGFKTLAHYLPGQGNALIVAQRDRLPKEAQDRLPSTGKDLNAGALVYEYGTDGNWTLVVTSGKDECLSEGACMLMDGDRVTQEKDSWAFAAAGSAESIVVSRSLSALIENGETLKGITNLDGISFIGPFRQESTVYLPFSGGFVLGEGGKIELAMRYSDNLDFDRSMVTVFWGETPVASKKLDREKAALDIFSFMMPSDVVGTHAASIKIAFDLEIKELYCTKRADEMPWAYVSGDSTLFLPVGVSSVYDLALRPYPFQRLGLFNSLAVVVPDKMTDVEYALFGRTAALLGANVSPYGTLKVWFASDYPTASQNCNVVALGTYRDNPFIRGLNDKLSFRYAQDGSCFESNRQLLLSERYASRIGILQLIRSPYQEGRAILCLSAADDTGLDSIERYCAVEENNWALQGDAFLIDDDLETKSYRFMEEITVRQATLREKLEKNRDAVLFTIISTAAMLLMLIAVLLILLRYRRNRREEDKK